MSPSNTTRPVIFLASPRAGGNSDTAARHFAQGAHAAGWALPEILPLRDYYLRPCTGCGTCAKTGQCMLSRKDDATHLHQKLANAPWAAFASPIYFYHLPAHFKAFIDRSQPFWEQRTAQEQAGQPEPPARPAYALLVGARCKGEQLFTGSLLTLKYFLWNFHMQVTGSRQFYGKDGPAELEADPDACALAREMGASMPSPAPGS